MEEPETGEPSSPRKHVYPMIMIPGEMETLFTGSVSLDIRFGTRGKMRDSAQSRGWINSHCMST
jgi:hypothetical protein